jgi:DNA-binding transcriptional LysR family regulator
MDERALDYFEAVVGCGSLRAAARQLYVSPSSITRKLQALETEMGVSLFDRAHAKLRATHEGDALLQFIRERRQHEISFRTRLDNLLSGETGLIRVSIGGGFVNNFVTSTLPAFMREHPKIRYQLVVAGGDEIIRLVKRIDVDIAMVYEPKSDPAILIVEATPQPLHAIAGTDHPLARAGEDIQLADLARYPLALLSPTFHVRQLITTMELRAGITLKAHVECNTFHLLRSLLANCGLVTILPDFCFFDDISKGRLVSMPIVGNDQQVPMAYLIRPANRTIPRAASLLLEFMQSHSIFQSEDESEGG